MIRRFTSTLLLAWLLSACSDPGAGLQKPAGFDPTCEGRADNYFAGMKKTSASGDVTIEIVAAEPAPPANSDMNMWTLKLSDGSGAAIAGADVIGAPFMIDHGHGSPNQIATEPSAGRYKVGPLALKMAGLWQVTLKVTPVDAKEAVPVVFYFCIPPA
jgi:hypothetical protein